MCLFTLKPGVVLGITHWYIGLCSLGIDDCQTFATYMECTEVSIFTHPSKLGTVEK